MNMKKTFTNISGALFKSAGVSCTALAAWKIIFISFLTCTPSICLADYIKDIKLGSGNWMKDSDLFPTFNGWQDGYGAFTYNIRQRQVIIDYIKNQKEHHKTERFYDEFKRMLTENGIAFDEKYLL